MTGFDNPDLDADVVADADVEADAAYSSFRHGRFLFSTRRYLSTIRVTEVALYIHAVPMAESDEQ